MKERKVWGKTDSGENDKKGYGLFLENFHFKITWNVVFMKTDLWRGGKEGEGRDIKEGTRSKNWN